MKVAKIIIFLFLLHGTAISQDTNTSYRYVSFENFISEKVKNDSVFILEMYRAIGIYPQQARKNEVSGKVEVLMLNHSSGHIEFIYSRESCIFNSPQHDIEKVFIKNTYNRDEKFFTRFYIIYDLEPWRVKKRDYHKTYKGLVKNNSFVVPEYVIPEIENQY